MPLNTPDSTLLDASGNVLVGQKTSATSLPVVLASDQAAISASAADSFVTGTLTTLNSTVQLATSGLNGAGFQITSTTLVGTIVPEVSFDGGTTWNLSAFDDPTTGNKVASLAVSSGVPVARTLVAAGGMSHVRVRVSAYTSGSASITLRGSAAIDPSAEYAGQAGSPSPLTIAQVGGMDTGGNLRPLRMYTDGTLRIDPSGTTTQPISGTVGQGTAAATSGAWPVKITDGTNTAAVKAASTAAVATDPAEVVTLSPNSPLPAGTNVLGAVTQSGGPWTVGTPDTVATGTLTTTGSAVQVAMAGLSGVAFQITTASTLVGTLVAEVSIDGGTTWNQTGFSDYINGVLNQSITTTSGTAYGQTIVPIAGMSHARVRVSTYTSGSASITLRASEVSNPPNLSMGAKNAGTPPLAIQVGGSDGSNLRALRTATDGTVRIDPSGTTTQPVAGTGTAGSPGTSALTIQGISGGTPVPVTSSSSDLVVTGTLGSLNATVQIATAGYAGVGLQLAAGTLIGTLVAEVSIDGGTTWNATLFNDVLTSNNTPTVVFASSNTATAKTLIGVGGAGLVRVRVSAYTSGTAGATVRASVLRDPSTLTAGAAGSALPSVLSQIGGSATTAAPSYTNNTLNPLSLTAAGALRIDGSAVTQPVSIASAISANQGTPNTVANSWPVKVTDGTNTMPTADVAARAQFHKLTDGTNTAAVKAASTAPVATDPALVVAISPNSTITTTAGALADLTATGALGSLNAAVSVNTAGYATAGFQLAAGTLIGTIVPEVSFDGGTTWNGTYFDTATGGKLTSIVFASANTASAATIVGVGGSGLSRVRVSAYTSGTANITVRATTRQDPSVLFASASGGIVPPGTAQVGGTDGVNVQPLKIKPASTAAVATDPSLVVAISPNSNSVNLGTQQTIIHNNATITSSGQVVITGLGRKEATLSFTITGAIGGTGSPTITYTVSECDALTGSIVTVPGNSNNSGPFNHSPSSYYFPVISYTGAVLVQWTLTGTSPSFAGVNAVLTCKEQTFAYGLSGTFVTSPLTAVAVDTNSNTTVVGPVAAGAAPAGAPVLVSGVDSGGLTRSLVTDTAGHLAIIGTGTAGGSSAGILSVQGVTGGTPLPVSSSSSDLVVTGTLGSLNATVQIATAGYAGVGLQLAAGTLIGTLVAETSFDNGTTWNATLFNDALTSNNTSTIVFSSSNPATAKTLVGVGGAGLVRVRVSAYTSGTAGATVRASALKDPSTLTGGAAGSALPSVLSQIGGAATTAAPSYTNNTLNPLSLTASGALRVDGSAVTQPVSIASAISANQGTANTIANGWPVKVTDGTNTMPTADVAARAQFHKLTDGTNTAAVKAASTAAVATDPALVVAVSPNNTISIIGTGTAGGASAGILTVQGTTGATPIPVTSSSSDVVGTSGTLNAANTTAVISLAGLAGVGFSITTASTLVSTLVAELSFDGGVTYPTTTYFFNPSSGFLSKTPTFTTSASTAYALSIVTSGGASHARVRVSTYVSGSATVTLRATDATGSPNLYDGAVGTSLQPPTISQVGGWTGSNLVPLSVNTSGQPVVTQVDGYKATYSATLSFAVVTSATDIAGIWGNASKVVRVTRVYVSMNTTGTATAVNFGLYKRIAANTGGTPTVFAGASHDSNSAASSSNATQYAANPTTGGGTMIYGRKTAILVGTALTDNIEVIFGTRNDQAIVLRGVAQGLTVNLGGTNGSGTNAYVTFEWTEE